MVIANQIREYPLMSGLSEIELSSLAPCFSKRVYAKGAYLFYPGSTRLNIYLVESGLIRLFFTNRVGQEFLLDLVGPRAAVGLPVLRVEQTRVVGAAALQPSTLLVLAQDDLNSFMRHSPRFMHNVNQAIDVMIRRLLFYSQGLATLSLNGRLATTLLTLTRDDKVQGVRNELELPISQADLATWIGASRGALNRALSHLQQLGLIRIEGRKITILDRSGLQHLTEDLLIDQE